MNEVNQYILDLIKAFEDASDNEVSSGQSAYMKHKFDFFGIKSPERKALQRPFFLKSHLHEKKNLSVIINTLWERPERELQYCGQELAFKYLKNLEENDLTLYEYMITHKSWWDTVDFIASNLVGAYFKLYPEQRWHICKKWLQSENIWLQRATLLFQLKYKTEVDTTLLENNIKYLLGSDEFFINKAIGWILREYSKTNPEWVMAFIKRTELHSLSFREGTKYIRL